MQGLTLQSSVIPNSFLEILPEQGPQDMIHSDFSQCFVLF